MQGWVSVMAARIKSCRSSVVLGMVLPDNTTYIVDCITAWQEFLELQNETGCYRSAVEGVLRALRGTTIHV